jgi:hypothetical protein
METNTYCEICNKESTTEICNHCEATRPIDCPICAEVEVAAGEICAACQEEIDGQDGFAECAYCCCDVPALTYQEACLSGWEIVAEEHAKDCEWVLTRAHTL